FAELAVVRLDLVLGFRTQRVAREHDDLEVVIPPGEKRNDITVHRPETDLLAANIDDGLLPRLLCWCFLVQAILLRSIQWHEQRRALGEERVEQRRRLALGP